MKLTLKHAVVLLVLCGCPGAPSQPNDPDQPTVDAGPEVVDAGPDPRLPAGAIQVDQATWDVLAASPSSHPDTVAQAALDREAELQLQLDNRHDVDRYFTEHAADTGVSSWALMVRSQPDPTDPDVIADADGYRLTIATRAGPFVTHTMGDAFIYASVARTIRSSTNRQNREALYLSLVNTLPTEAFAQFNLPRSEQVPALVDEQLEAAIRLVGRHAIELTALVTVPVQVVTPIRGCGDDFGYGKLLDRNGFNPVATVDACAVPSVNGIVGRLEFPLKPSLSCVKDQGRRGTCWSFAATSMMEAAEAVNRGARVNYSEQDLVNRVKLSWWPSSYGDNAGQDIIPRMISEHYKPVYENAWSYNPSTWRVADDTTLTLTHSCDSYVEDCSNKNHQGRQYCLPLSSSVVCLFAGHDNPNTTNAPTHFADALNPVDFHTSVAITTVALALKLQVEIAFEVMPAFDAAANGDGFMRFDPTAPAGTSRGGHVVHAVGYVDNATLANALPNAPPAAGGGYLVLKNSWGACSGDASFIYMPLAYVQTYAYGIQILQTIE